MRGDEARTRRGRLHVRETRDREALRDLLSRDPAAAAYLLGDLAPPFFDSSRWIVAGRGDLVEAVVLVYGGLEVPAVLSHGSQEAVRAILDPKGGALPEAAWAKIPPEHEAVFAGRFRLEDAEKLHVMALSRGELRRAAAGAVAVRIAEDAPLDELEQLYAGHPGHFFEPSALRSGVYFGVRRGGRLVAVAGTHVFAPDEGVAVLGNIVTAADQRGRGLARACAGALAAALFEAGCRTVALHVAQSNAPAIACYRALGFRARGEVLQCRIAVGDAGHGLRCP